MPSTDPTAAADRREFRTRFLWAAVVPWWVLAATWLLALADVSLSVLFVFSPFSWSWAADPGWWDVGFSLAGASLLALGVARAYLLDARRVVIVAAGDGLTITDRRWRTREIPWSAIREVRVHRWQGPTFGPMLRLVTSTGTVKLPELVAKPELLVEEIVTRAGLTQVQRGRFRLTYRRGQGPAPQEESA